MKYKDWTSKNEQSVRNHKLVELKVTDSGVAIDRVAARVPEHYVDPKTIADILDRLGSKAAAKRVRALKPLTARGRSGDLGEILAAGYVVEALSGFDVLMKLRWKDHREMAMRGDDLIAISKNDGGPPRFLKGEVKSRASATAAVVAVAREKLSADRGRPNPQTLSFVAERFRETGRTDLARLIDPYLVGARIGASQVVHLLFIFSGSGSGNHLRDDLKNYRGKAEQHAVCLRVESHQKFIRAVFTKAGL